MKQSTIDSALRLVSQWVTDAEFEAERIYQETGSSHPVFEENVRQARAASARLHTLAGKRTERLRARREARVPALERRTFVSAWLEGFEQNMRWGNGEAHAARMGDMSVFHSGDCMVGARI